MGIKVKFSPKCTLPQQETYQLSLSECTRLEEWEGPTKEYVPSICAECSHREGKTIYHAILKKG